MLKPMILAACIAAAPGVALAVQPGAPTQSPAPPFASNPAAPNSGQSGQAGAPSATQTRKQSLAQKLSQSNGTIQPPAVDPGMSKAPPPSAGTMPIVKPPANVQSK